MCAAYGLDATHLSFYMYMHTSIRMCARKIDDVKPIVQNSRILTRHVHDILQKHVCIHTCQIWITCMQIVAKPRTSMKMFTY